MPRQRLALLALAALLTATLHGPVVCAAEGASPAAAPAGDQQPPSDGSQTAQPHPAATPGDQEVAVDAGKQVHTISLRQSGGASSAEDRALQQAFPVVIGVVGLLAMLTATAGLLAAYLSRSSNRRRSWDGEAGYVAMVNADEPLPVSQAHR